MEKGKVAKKGEVFEKKPKATPKTKPEVKKADKAEGIFEATEGDIKEGGLRKSLKVNNDYKFTRSVLNKLRKNEVGSTFDFEGKTQKMTERLAKQVQLALNMMKK
tara:strand:- start:6406 stop:6720 length:315 start_codon:yes stop_codon:yes gene_type:complete